MREYTNEGIRVVSETAIHRHARDVETKLATGLLTRYGEDCMRRIERENPLLYSFCTRRASAIELTDLSRYDAFLNGIILMYELFETEVQIDRFDKSRRFPGRD